MELSISISFNSAILNQDEKRPALETTTGFMLSIGCTSISKACEASLEELAKLAKELPTCLLCFEREPQCCHRSMVAGAMKASYDFAVVDLCVGHSEQPKDDAPRKSSYHSREGASAA